MTYWSSGGEILASGVGAISLADAEALLSLHRDEARAATEVRSPEAFSRAHRLAAELGEALSRARLWRRASGVVRFSP